YPMVSKTAIWAVYPSNRQLAPKVRAFIDFFLEYYGQTPYWESALEE
ncbi:MAG: LysR family transcriptional regulator, partial [Paraglaciecola chathamensis]